MVIPEPPLRPSPRSKPNFKHKPKLMSAASKPSLSTVGEPQMKPYPWLEAVGSQLEVKDWEISQGVPETYNYGDTKTMKRAINKR